jgi:outer membrane protein assembly factor BamB
MKINRSLPIVVSSCVVLFTALVCPAQDWPQYLGANREARAQFTPPKAWPKELTAKWKVTVGDGVATPSLLGDRLYVFSREDGGEILRCLDAASGKEIWKSEKLDVLPASPPAQGFPGPRCSPSVAEGKVVTLGLRGTLSCYDAAKGTLLWRKEDFKGVLPRFLTSASPVVADGLCLASLGGGDQGGVIAYALASGEEKWRWEGEGASYASPVLMTVGDTKLVISEMEKRIVALGVKDGKLRWETPFAVPGRGYNSSTPVVSGSTLIYGGSGRGFTAVKLAKEGDAITAKELWKNTENSVQFNTLCISKDGKTAWSAPLSPASATPTNPPPAAPSASDAGGTNTQTATRGTDGDRGGPGRDGRRGGPGGRGGGGRGYGQIVDAGSVMLALTPASELVAFQPSDKAYTELARIKVADSPTYAYPVVSGKRIFVKDQNSVALFTLD